MSSSPGKVHLPEHSPLVQPAGEKPLVRINFSDFWGHFNPTDNYFWKLLSESFELELSDKPDFLIYSAYGREFTKYDCVRIFFTGEAAPPDFHECDFSFSFDYIDDPRHYRLPLYALYADNTLLTNRSRDPESILRTKTRFCNFVVSNGGCRKRNEFFLELSKYKQVDSAGRFMNNMGQVLPPGPPAKWAFLEPYKFSIAFESKLYPGYTTEKIFEPMLVDSMPLYWGNPLVGRDFNTKSFLNLHEYANEAEFIDRIREVDAHDRLYVEYMSQPWFTDNKVNAFVDPANVTAQFAFIFSQQSKVPRVAKSHHRVYSAAKGAGIWTHAKAAAALDRLGRISGRR